MNTWGYLILITALLLLAGVMLYARFASRSREKSLHHPPVEWVFLPEAISVAPAAGHEVESREKSETVTEPHVRLDRVSAPAEGDQERGYFDELQEAAAGLAKLMRSSPVAKSEPVVFAPEIEAVEEVAVEEAAALEEVVLEEVIAEDEPEVALSSEGFAEAAHDFAEEWISLTDECVEAEDTFISMEETVADLNEAESVVELPIPVRVLSLREIVGETVADQLDRLDEGLDALDSLVLGIEASLQALGDLERNEFEALTDDLLDEEVAAAA